MVQEWVTIGFSCTTLTFIGAWVWDAFTSSALLDMDDSDLFHMALGTPLDDEF
jgi:hypothetical protein